MDSLKITNFLESALEGNHIVKEEGVKTNRIVGKNYIVRMLQNIEICDLAVNLKQYA